MPTKRSHFLLLNIDVSRLVRKGLEESLDTAY